MDVVTPQNLDAERCVLGAPLLLGQVPPAVVERVQPEDFYFRSHAVIYQAQLDLNAQGRGIDSKTLVAELARTGQLGVAGGAAAVDALAAAPPDPGNAAEYALIVADM